MFGVVLLSQLVGMGLTVVIASLIALVGAVWIARRMAGPLAGVATAAIMAVSPVYLENSRLAFVEAPSLAPTVLAICAVASGRSTIRRPVVRSTN